MGNDEHGAESGGTDGTIFVKGKNMTSRKMDRNYVFEPLTGFDLKDVAIATPCGIVLACVGSRLASLYMMHAGRLWSDRERVDEYPSSRSLSIRAGRFARRVVAEAGKKKG